MSNHWKNYTHCTVHIHTTTEIYPSNNDPLLEESQCETPKHPVRAMGMGKVMLKRPCLCLQHSDKSSLPVCI